jgi:hypothetical protein
MIPLAHGNTGRKPLHAASSESRDAVKNFILNYANIHGLPDPGRDIRKGKGHLRVLLPTIMNYHSVHRVYEENSLARGDEPLGYRSFLRIWEEEVAHVEFSDPRSDLCMSCEEFKKKINQVCAHLDEEKEDMKAEIYRQALDHLIDVKKERSYYRAAAKVAQDCYQSLKQLKKSTSALSNSKDIHMHYSWDFAQQLQYPYEEQQVGPIYFKTPRRAQLFGVCIEGIPKQINYLIDEADFPGKDANTVVSLLDHFFSTHGLGEKFAQLTADNCVGQNKNNTVLQYLLYRVITSLHTEIRLSFLVVGHTKFSPDGYFGLIRKKYRRSNVYTYDQLAQVIQDSSVTGHSECQRYQEFDSEGPTILYRDWTAWLDQFFCKLPNITNYQHFRLDSSNPGIVFFKERINSKELSFCLLRPKFRKNLSALKKTKPNRLMPDGLSVERQWYLHDQIGMHIPEKTDRESTCPKPRVRKVIYKK